MDDPKEGLQAVLFFGFVSILISFYAWRKGYFRLSKLPDPPFMRFLYVWVGFLFYLVLFFFLSPLLGEMLKSWIPIQKDQVVSYISWINFSTLSVSTLFILLFYGLCFPDAFQKIMKRSLHPLRSDILLGLATLAIERMYAYSGDHNDKDQYLYYGKTGGCIITGNEDGIKHCAMDILYALQHIGYTIPPQADCGWIGEAGPGPSYGDTVEGSDAPAGYDNQFTNRNATFMAWNLMHMARILKDSQGLPAKGNTTSDWQHVTNAQDQNPEYR